MVGYVAGPPILAGTLEPAATSPLHDGPPTNALTSAPQEAMEDVMEDAPSESEEEVIPSLDSTECKTILPFFYTWRRLRHAPKVSFSLLLRLWPA
jgi:hypothetical protein